MIELPKTIRRWSMYLTILNLSVFIYAFMTDFYMPFIYLAYIQFGLFFLTLKPHLIDKVEISFICFILGLFFFASLHPDKFRLSTILYTFLFVTSFLFYRQNLKRNVLKLDHYLKFLKYIIYAYTIVMILQQVQFYANMDVFNKAVWQITADALDDGKLKFNSLALEASNVPLIMIAILYAYISLKEKVNGRKYSIKELWIKEKKIVICTLFTIIGTRSTTAIFILCLFFTRYLTKETLNKYFPSIILSIVFLGIVIINFIPVIAERFANVISYVIQFDYMALIQADGSAACRIAPHFIYWNDFNIFDINTWFGHGIDSLTRKTTFLILGDPDRKVGAENIMCFVYDYGFIMGVWLFILMKKLIFKKIFSYNFLLYILGFSILTLNHYVFWLYMMLMYTVNYYNSKLIYKTNNINISKKDLL